MTSEKQGLLPTDPPPSYEISSHTLSAPPRSPSGPPKKIFPLHLPALDSLRTRRLILASTSPRRSQILSLLGLPTFEIIPPHFPEDLSKTTLSPFEYVLQTATQKALDVYRREINNHEKGEPGLIIAADTIVVSSMGEIMEKPRSEAEHVRMLKTLRDTGMHKVHTAVAVMTPLESARDPGYALETAVEETGVLFDREVTDELLVAYVRTREGADKAGGYGLQGLGSVLVERIEGAADNVVGLPLRAVVRLVEKVVRKGDDEDVLEGEEELALGNGEEEE
ncbi:MAG: hypothetical protein Q9227_000153 [Pyrenula ochraceoflavens]